MQKLKEELERQKAQRPAQKYIRRGDLIKAEEKKQEAVIPLTVSESTKVTKHELTNETKQEESLPTADSLDFQLRELNLPIRLFGETDSDRYHRLLVARPNAKKRKRDNTTPQLDSSWLEPPEQTNSISMVTFKESPNETRENVCLYLKRLLYAWQKSIKDDEKESRYFMETEKSLQPFFSRLSSNNLDEDIIRHLIQICHYLQQHQFSQANDTYLQLAIGNAPWPMGVTSTSIHERSAQEKIESVAHVLNDEVQRKWIQSVKRLMTFAEKRYKK